MNENIVREKTVCFTGHRTEKLPQGDGLVLLRKRLANEIERALQDGYDTFLFGGAYGFDLMAAEVITLNTHYYNQCYAQRNQYMVDHSNRVICCWNRQSVSGTAQTVRMAERQNLEIINLL